MYKYKHYNNLKGCFYDYFEHDYNYSLLPPKVYEFMNKLNRTPETLKYNLDHKEWYYNHSFLLPFLSRC